MNALFKQLAEVEDGDLVVGLVGGVNYLGIKGIYKDMHVVVLLCSKFDDEPGPYTLVDINKEWSVVTLGKDWIVDFDPVTSIRTDLGCIPPLGSMVIEDSGLAIVTTNESEKHLYSLKGQLGTYHSKLTFLKKWRILVREYDNQYKEIYRWPEKSGGQ